jgi:hypothetical protein
MYLTAYQCLNFVAARTGGGSLSVQAHNRNYGQLGKYNDIMQSLSRMAMALLKPYMSSVVGS